VPVPAKGGKGRLVVGAVVVVVVCAGLWGVGRLINNVVNKDGWKDLGQPVTRLAVQPLPTPTWKWPNPFQSNAKADPQIRYELESWVLESAGVQKPVSSTCDNKGSMGDSAATFDCTVTFEGQSFVYTVSTTPKGNHVFTWTAKAAKAAKTIVTREEILRLLAHQYPEADGWSNLRCDTLTEIVLAPVGQALPQVCYVKPKDTKTQNPDHTKRPRRAEPGDATRRLKLQQLRLEY
jgi:hypothetical protein